MHRITFFTKSECTLCDSAMFVIKRVQAQIPFELESVDITANGNEEWHRAYGHDIPVIHLNGREIFRHRVNERELKRLLSVESSQS